MFTLVKDTHSGGSKRSKWDSFIIETNDKKEVDTILREITGYGLYSVKCECCGRSFIIFNEDENFATLDEALYWAHNENVRIVLEHEVINICD